MLAVCHPFQRNEHPQQRLAARDFERLWKTELHSTLRLLLVLLETYAKRFDKSNIPIADDQRNELRMDLHRWDMGLGSVLVDGVTGGDKLLFLGCLGYDVSKTDGSHTRMRGSTCSYDSCVSTRPALYLASE